MRKFYFSCMMLLYSLIATAQFPAPYCNVTNANNIEPITLVNFAGINQTSPNTIDAGPTLIDYTSVVGTVGRGVAYPITLKGNTNGSFTTVFRAYIDWNQDGDFTDAGESFDLGSIVNSTGVDAIQLVSSITVPTTASLGNTRMRIFKKFSSYPADACTNTWGQAQDYTLNVTVAPPASNIVSTGTGGLWSDPATWAGGSVPLNIDNVTIADGATVTIDVLAAVNNLNIGQGASGTLTFNSTTANTLTVTGNLTTMAGSTFNPFNGTTGRVINVGGNLVLDGSADFTKTSTALLLNGTTPQTVSGTGNLGTGSPVRLLAITNPAGVTLSRSLSITSTLNLVQGVLSNGTNLTMDNTIGGVTTTTCAIQKGLGSLSDPILTGATATLNVAYVFFTGTTNAAAIVGNEIPASGVINALTINNALGVTLNKNLSVAASASALTFTSGILTVNPANILTATNASYNGTAGTATSHVNGKIGLTWGTSATKTYPIGSAGQLRTVITTGSIGSGVVAFSIVNPSGGTAGTGMSALTATRRWFGEVVSGSITSYTSISIAYGNDDAFGNSTAANRRVAQSSTLSGAYNSIGPATHTSSPLVSSTGTYTSLDYFALGLSAGSLPITWDGGAGTISWSDANNWSTDAVPTNADEVILNAGNNVALTGGSGTYSVKSLFINNGASLTLNSANTLNIAGATGNNSLLVLDGTLNMSAGTINLNGSMAVGTSAAATANLQMSGGLIVIDGNDGTAAASSVATGVHMFGLGYNAAGTASASTGLTANITGGTIRIVDPNYNSASTALSFAVSINSTNTNTVNLSGLTLEFGDGTSGTAGQTTGFVFNTYVSSKKVRIGNVICNTRTDLHTSRFVQTTSSSSDGSDIEGNLTVNANSEIRAISGRSDLSVGGNIINNGTITITGTTNARLYLGGKAGTGAVAITTPQTISGTGVFRNSTTTTTANVTGMVVDNAGGVTFPSDFSVSNNLTLTAGNVNMGANTLTLGISTATTGTMAFTTGRVLGKFKRYISGTGTYNFPVGITTNTRNAAINFTTAPATGGTLTGEWISGSSGGNGLPLTEGSITIERTSIEGFWRLTPADGLAGGTFTGTFTPNGIVGVSDFTKLVLLKRNDNASPWTLEGTHVATTGTNALPVLSRTAMSGFGEFGIGSSTENTLPVMLVNFRGEQSGSTNRLLWSTSTETNNRGFDLERSSDGRNYSSIAFVTSKAENGNSNSTLNYNYNDVRPLTGNNYYRLKQMDNDGKTTVSNVVLLSGKVSDITLSSVYPNPATRALNVVITSPKAEKVTIMVSDLTGKVVMQTATQLAVGDNQQTFNVQQLAAGTYVIKAVCANGCETAVQRFVKQ